MAKENAKTYKKKSIKLFSHNQINSNVKLVFENIQTILWCFLILFPPLISPPKIVSIIFLHLYTSLAAVSTFQGAAVALLPPFAHQQLYYYE